MSLSMPNSRKIIRKQEAVAAQLKQELKARGIRRKAQREKLVQKAASGRPADLPQIARAELDKWRRNRQIQQALDTIAGRA
jgi:glutamate racemase